MRCLGLMIALCAFSLIAQEVKPPAIDVVQERIRLVRYHQELMTQLTSITTEIGDLQKLFDAAVKNGDKAVSEKIRIEIQKLITRGITILKEIEANKIKLRKILDGT